MGQRIASLFAEIGADTRGVEAGLRKTKAGLQSASGDFKTFGSVGAAALAKIAVASAAIGVAIRGIEKVYQLGRAGAFLELTEARFNRMAEEIGVTADALQRDLRVATRGTISDMKALELASQVLSLRLVRNGDDAVRLATIIAALGADVGEVTLALTNQTTRRFDQIGIAVEGFEDRLKDLRATGMDTEAAFTEAFLQQGERQIERIGNVADESAGAFLRLEAAWANYVDGLKRDLSGPLATYINFQLKIREESELAKRALDENIISQDEYARGLENTWGYIVPTIELLDTINQRYAEQAALLTAINESSASWDQAKLASLGIMTEETTAVFDLNAALDTLALTIDGPLGRAYEEFGQEQMDMLQQYAQLRDAIAFFEGQPQTDEGIAELANLRTEMANVEQAIIDGSAAFDEQTRRILFDIVLQRLAIAELPEDMRAAAFSMVNDLAFAWGLIDQTTWEATGRIDQAFALLAQGNVQAAKQALFELGGWANSVAGDYYMRFHVVVDQQTAWDQAGMPDEGQGGSGVGGAANDLFPPGSSGWVPPSFSPPDFGGGGVASLPELPPTLAQMAAPFLDTANALSQIGSFFADKLQDELIDPLQAKIDAIDALLSPQHIDMVARERALELEQERVLAAEELAEAQEKLLALQKAQSELQFLEYQIKLLDLIQEHGLNADDILGGLKLGIDADAGDVIEAITKAIQALIAQAEEELGIASPSKVAAEWGAQIIRGLVVGVQGEMAQLAQVPRDLSEALFMEAGVAVGDKPGPGGCLTINVYPSEGMSEEDLARKVGAVVQRHLL